MVVEMVGLNIMFMMVVMVCLAVACVMVDSEGEHLGYAPGPSYSLPDLLFLLPELLLLQFVGGGLLMTSHAALTGTHEVLDGHNLAEGGAKGHHEGVEVGGSAFPLVPLEPGKKTIN